MRSSFDKHAFDIGLSIKSGLYHCTDFARLFRLKMLSSAPVSEIKNEKRVSSQKISKP